MARLAETPAGAGLLPLSLGDMSLTEVVEPITSVAPFKGQEKVVGDALGGWPKPNRSKGNVLWSGRNQAFVVGDLPALPEGAAALTDQSDGWIRLVLEGPQLEAVLSRLTPLDIRSDVMKRGHTARSLLGHMNALYWRAGLRRMEIFVFRSMAATAVHELQKAMESVAARGKVDAVD